MQTTMILLDAFSFCFVAIITIPDLGQMKNNLRRVGNKVFQASGCCEWWLRD